MISDFEMRYNRFIQDTGIFMVKNRKKPRNHYFNIYFDDGASWVKVEPYTYYDLLSRAFTKEKIIDPVLSFTVGEVLKKIKSTESKIEMTKILCKFLKLEIPQTSFDTWEEFS